MKKALPLALVLLACIACKPKPEARAEDAAALSSVSVPAPVASPSASAVAPASTCIHVDEDEAKAGITTLEGTVNGGEHSHPNGSSFKFYTLKLPKPTCVQGSEEEKETQEVQIFSSAKIAINDTLIGKKVTVTGSAFPQQTAWHVRPVVIDVKTLTRK